MDDGLFFNAGDLLATGVILVFVIVALIIALGVYVLSSYGYYRIAKANGFGDIAITAWIPIANAYLIAMLIAPERDKKDRIKWGWGYVILNFLLAVISGATGGVIAIFSWALSTYILYLYFKAWDTEDEKTTGRIIVDIILTFITLGVYQYVIMYKNLNTVMNHNAHFVYKESKPTAQWAGDPRGDFADPDRPQYTKNTQTKSTQDNFSSKGYTNQSTSSSTDYPTNTPLFDNTDNHKVHDHHDNATSSHTHETNSHSHDTSTSDSSSYDSSSSDSSSSDGGGGGD